MIHRPVTWLISPDTYIFNKNTNKHRGVKKMRLVSRDTYMYTWD